MDSYDQYDNVIAAWEQDDHKFSWTEIVERNSIGLSAVLQHLQAIICTAFLARFLHLLIDLSLNNDLKYYKHTVTYLAGCYQIYQHFEGNATQIVIHLIFLLLMAQELRKNNQCQKDGFIERMISSNVCFLTNEFIIYFLAHQQLIKLRPILMTLVMKHIAGAYTKNFELSERLAHYLHPASCIFGPWHPIMTGASEGSTSAFETFKSFAIQFGRSVKSLIQAFIILTISNIISEQAEAVTDSAPMLVQSMAQVYLRALEFRLSHYFICYLSQSFIALWHPDKLKAPELCRISKIELPRSLVEVVVYWNMNMHLWLKEFCFKPLKLRTKNIFLPIIITYLISSWLHGFKFHIWAVLLSLGFFTWIEHSLRIKLARNLDACVTSRDCRKVDRQCVFKHSRNASNSSMVLIINFTFRIIAIVQLAYLGYIFAGDTDIVDYKVAISSWSELHFFGHYLALLMFMLSNAIN